MYPVSQVKYVDHVTYIMRGFVSYFSTVGKWGNKDNNRSDCYRLFDSSPTPWRHESQCE